MASHVQVVLREDVSNLGQSGEVVKVRPGYARNYLIPRGMAVMATRGNLRQIEHEQRAARVAAARMAEEAEGIAAALAEVVLPVPKQVGEEGKLYGSVTAAEIAEILKDKGYRVDKRKLEMPKEPIKHTGTYEIAAKLAVGVHQTFKIDVVPEQ